MAKDKVQNRCNLSLSSGSKSRCLLDSTLSMEAQINSSCILQDSIACVPLLDRHGFPVFE
jgi:hypothetical protein